MSTYGPLARWYDALTEDVPYEQLADFYEKLLCREGKEKLTLLDLCCGTGTLTCILASRGHELIGTDMSEDMLAVAREKSEAVRCPTAPMFLCQEVSELDLYGTVEGAYCSLDGMNYIPPEELPELLRRLHLFIEPGGVFAFDFHSPEHLKELDGGTFVDENDDMLCLWRAEYDVDEKALFYGMDIFQRRGRLWSRDEEEHVEYAHEPEMLCALLKDSGFENAEVITDGVLSASGRLFIRCVNTGH